MLARSEQYFQIFSHQLGQFSLSFGMEQTEKYQTCLREG
jgi:hypothetical protein